MYENLATLVVIHVFFAYLFAIFEILINLPILISSCFKMQLLRVLKLRNTYILPPS